MATKKQKKTVSPATVAKQTTEAKKEAVKPVEPETTEVKEETKVDEVKAEETEVDTQTPDTAAQTEVETAGTEEEPEVVPKEVTTVPETPAAPAAKEPVTTTDTVKEKEKPAPTNVEVSAAVAQFNRLAESYLKTAKVSSTSSGSSRAASTNAFITLMDFVCNSKDRKVLDAFYNFFVTNRKGMLAHNVVLAGVANLESTRRIRVGTFYTTFFALANFKVDRVPFRLDLNAIRLVTNDAVTNYVAMKLR